MLKLTTARYLRPAGTALNKNGVEPDVCLVKNYEASKKPSDVSAGKVCPGMVRSYRKDETDEEVEYATRYLLDATQSKKLVRQK